MELFLMVLCVSMLSLALCGVAFSAATKDVVPQAEPKPLEAPAIAAAAPRFFADTVPAMAAAAAPAGAVRVPRMPPVPIEALLLQIERHVRLEQAAAEAFLEFPTSASLHSRTTSPLVH